MKTVVCIRRKFNLPNNFDKTSNYKYYPTSDSLKLVSKVKQQVSLPTVIANLSYQNKIIKAKDKSTQRNVSVISMKLDDKTNYKLW